MLLRTLLLFLFCPLISFSQGWIPMGGRSNSMANASVAFEDVWAYHHNPAGLASLKSFSAGLSYENRFLLKELQSQGLTVALPLKTGVLSFGAQLYGFELYRTQKVGAGYSIKLSEKFSAGVQLNYQGIRLTDNYGSKHSATAELGILGEITENWKIGVSVFNLGRAKLADFADDRFTTLMRLGTSYKVSDKVLFSAEAEKNIEYPLRFKAGMEYQAVKNFFFRFGAATAPVEITFGFGYKFKTFQLDLGSAYHQRLGWSPNVSLTYQLDKN
jgi:hypothetical protein